MAENLNFKLYLILTNLNSHGWLVAIVLDSVGQNRRGSWRESILSSGFQARL